MTAPQTFNLAEVPSSLLNTEQAADYIGTQPQTLENWRCNKRYGLPYLKIGRLVRYRRADLDAWLSDRRVSDDRR